MMMVIFYLIGSLERERESFAPIETFFCQSNLFVFVDNTWVVSLSDSWTTIFQIWGFQVSTHVGRFFDFVKKLWFLVFFFWTLEIKGNLSGSSFFCFFFHKYIQNHLNIFRIKKPLIQGFLGGGGGQRTDGSHEGMEKPAA
jgi:hypothetical protein